MRFFGWFIWRNIKLPYQVGRSNQQRRKIDDTEQHGTGDCWLLSGVNALSYTEEGKKAIDEAIEWTDDGCTVTLKGLGEGEDSKIEITNEEIVKIRQEQKENKNNDATVKYSTGDDIVMSREDFLNTFNRIDKCDLNGNNANCIQIKYPDEIDEENKLYYEEATEGRRNAFGESLDVDKICTIYDKNGNKKEEIVLDRNGNKLLSTKYKNNRYGEISAIDSYSQDEKLVIRKSFSDSGTIEYCEIIRLDESGNEQSKIKLSEDEIDQMHERNLVNYPQFAPDELYKLIVLEDTE